VVVSSSIDIPHWIYIAVVRPIVTYAATVWWPRVKLKTSQAELSKLQWIACLGITGAMRTAPTATIEVILGSYRLRCNDQWKPKSEGLGHAYITQDMKKEPILHTRFDKMIQGHVYDKPFMIRFPDRSEEKVGFQPDRKGGLGPSARRKNNLLKLNRDQLRRVVGLFTEHCHLQGHLFKLGLTR
jgi:hypothetical protein